MRREENIFKNYAATARKAVLGAALVAGMLAAPVIARAQSLGEYVTAGVNVDPRGTRLTAPVGGVFTGNHLWVSSAEGFNRLDPDGSGILLPQLSTSAGIPNGVVSGGQPAYDQANNVLYVPDRSGKSRGIFKITLDPITDQVISSYPIAPTSGLGGRAPSAVALGPDGNLYVGFQKSGDLVRILNPGAPQGTPLTVQTFGKTFKGGPTAGLAFGRDTMSDQLVIAGKDGMQVINGASSCQPCAAQLAPVAVGQPNNKSYYAVVQVGNDSSEPQYDGCFYFLGNSHLGSYCIGGGLTAFGPNGIFIDTVFVPFQFGKSMGLVNAGPSPFTPAFPELLVMDDKSDGTLVNFGRVFRGMYAQSGTGGVLP